MPPPPTQWYDLCLRTLVGMNHKIAMLVLTCILYISPYVRVDKWIKGMLKYMYMYLRTVLVKTTQVKIRAF